MLLNIFKINSYIVYVYLILFSLIIGVFAASFSVQANAFSHTAFSYIFKSPNMGWVATVSGIILLLANVVVFDLLVTSQEVSEKNNHIPAFLLGIFLSYATSQNLLHPILFAQLLVSISIWRFLSVYKSDKALSAIFDGAFSLSVAAVLYPPYMLFLLLGFIALLTLRSFSLREGLLALIGIFIPYFLYFSLLFLFDKVPQQALLDIIDTFHAPGIPVYSKGSFLINFVAGSFAVFTILFFLMKTKTVSNKIKTQKSFVVFLWMFILSIPTWFVVSTGAAFGGLLSIMPLSVFCGIYLSSAKSRILAELLVWALLILFVISILQQASVIN
jgi:hypothetical protein